MMSLTEAQCNLLRTSHGPTLQGEHSSEQGVPSSVLDSQADLHEGQKGQKLRPEHLAQGHVCLYYLFPRKDELSKVVLSDPERWYSRENTGLA